jgi:hypothetical protein
MSGSDQESYARNKARNAQLDERRARIRQLNDKLRQEHLGGRTVITHGVQALGLLTAIAVLLAVRQFDDFSTGNDPHEEHDFGAITCGDHRILWKIDYYDKLLQYGSPDAADPDVTTRVLTIMLASEY